MDGYWLSTTTSNSFAQLEKPDEPMELKEPRPPPIFVTVVQNTKPLQNLLNSLAPKMYDLKILGSESVKIQSAKPETFTVIVKALTEKKTSFHTYQPKQERAFRVVLLNIHPTTDIEDIKKELSELGHHVLILNSKKTIKKFIRFIQY